jgi:ubiquitin-activating enzyme E1
MRLQGPRARARGSLHRLRGGAGGSGAGDNNDVDEALYSRQLYVMGHAAQRSLASAAVLLIGLSGLGAEVSKNVALAGVASLDVHDPTPARYADLSTSWLLREADVGKPR